jgi:hypothetical protein
VALGAASATRQSFSRLSQIDKLIVRLIIFKICRFRNALFLNLGPTGFHSEWRARAPRREPSEGCFSEPRLLAQSAQIHFSDFSAYKFINFTGSVLQNVRICSTFVHWILIQFKKHFKLIVLLGIRTGTSFQDMCHLNLFGTLCLHVFKFFNRKTN